VLVLIIKKEICNYGCDYLFSNGSTLKSEGDNQVIGALQEGAVETRVHVECALGKPLELAVNSTITTVSSSLGNNSLSNSLVLPMIFVLILLIKSFKL
jgi:hypothetical protein